MRWVSTTMGFFNDGELHHWGDPISLLTLPGVSLVSKLRYGFFVFVCTHRDHWPALENQSAREWITRYCGKEIYERFWHPLLDFKYYEYANNISAAWIWTRIRRIGKSRKNIMQEELGYICGGSKTLVDALLTAIDQQRRPSAQVRWGRPLAAASTGTSWNEVAWLLGPFSLSYVLLLMPRGAFDLIQDRYMVGLVPSILIVILKLYEERVGPKLPAVSVIMLVLFALYAVAGTHDFYAESRAQVRAIRMVETTGVPRKQIQAGFPSDGWIQIENGGHINEPRIKLPADAYNPKSFSKIPDGCRDGFTNFAPVIDPKYFILFPWLKNPSFPPPSWCFVHADFPPVHYTSWLPPFQETIYVNKLPSSRGPAK